MKPNQLSVIIIIFLQYSFDIRSKSKTMDNPDVRLDILRGVIKEGDGDKDEGKEDLKEEKKEHILEKKIQFECSSCGLCEMCHYFGSSPPFVKNCLELTEECYVMLDP